MQISKIFRRALPAWVGLTLSIGSGAYAAPASAKEILNDLRRFRETGRVLFIAAHPDDENTWLLAYLARGRHYATGYLSLTRGDGGQNLIGPEFGDQLGVIRTQELLAARHIDGAVQFFSRARDFGFSKDYQQTLIRWDRQLVLADMVRVIRQFHPDVLITRFSPLPSTTHGHHTASAVLAVEAFKLAGDPKFLPEVPAWQPHRILYNQGGPGGSTGTEGLRLDVSGIDEVTGKTYGAVASESRSQHVSQGFGAFTNHDGPREETFQLLGGEPAASDLMEGVAPRMPEITPIADKALADFEPAHPDKSLPILLYIRNHMNALRGDPVTAEKYALLDRLILECAGIELKSTVVNAEVAPGEKVSVQQTVTVSSQTPVIWKNAGKELSRDHAATFTQEVTASGPPTQPYWLREEGLPGMFVVSDAALIGHPENPPTVSTTDFFQIGAQLIAVHSEPRDAAGRRVQIVSPVSLHFSSQAQLFAQGWSHPVKVVVKGRASHGSLRLEVPAGWKCQPAQQDLQIPATGGSQEYSFTVTAPHQLETVTLRAVARVGGADYSNDRIDIAYPHIPPLLLQPPARLKAVTLKLAIRGRTLGYLPGAGDSTVDSLQQMGYAVETLSGAELASPATQKLDAIVVGVRAYNVRKDFKPADLFRYVQNGGTVVVQYNTPRGLENSELAPYKLKLSENLPQHRVTDENSAVTILAPKHPALNVPNKIGPADFQGWVQERGLNFPSDWDRKHFTSLLACSDGGEPPLQSGLLVAHYGKGYFIYTGLSFFRQLPAGVPGAYRLFANLVSLGK